MRLNLFMSDWKNLPLFDHVNMLTDRRDIWATALVVIKHPCISPGKLLQDWSLKGGGVIFQIVYGSRS